MNFRIDTGAEVTVISEQDYKLKPSVLLPTQRSLRVGAVQTTKPEEQFPQLFTGLGNLEGEYEIKLR